MERKEILQFVQEMQGVEDLVKLLNKIKSEEFGTKEHSLTAKQLRFLCTDKVPNKYKSFQIKKKSGGTRVISAPCYQLSIILYLLNIVFKAIYTPSQSAMGFAEGKSIVDNASVHTGHRYLLNIDLKDFFPSIPQARVWARLQCKPFGFNREIADVVAGLCCIYDKERKRNVLPQGAATSPLLTNAICDKLDRQLSALARKYGLFYSRYADDISFSSMHNVYQRDGEFFKELKKTINNQGFELNDKKTRLLNDGERQEVTGLIVNEKVNINRSYIRKLRSILHVWEKDGYEKAYSYFYPHYKREKGYIKKGEPIMENVIEGKLNFMRMVRGENDEIYKKLLFRFQKLQEIVYMDNESEENESFVYVQPYKLPDFERMFKTKINLEECNGKIIGKCVLAGMDKTISISKSTQAFLYGSTGVLNPSSFETLDMLHSCHITLCRHKGKNFWLITKFSPRRSLCLSVPDVKINIDYLLSVWEIKGIESAVEEFRKYMNGISINEKSELIKAKRSNNKSSFVFLNSEEISELLKDATMPDEGTIS